MNKSKGAGLVLIIITLTFAVTVTLYTYTHELLIENKDYLFSKYYERAIASAISCREVAMARLNFDFEYRVIDEPIEKYNCIYSITNEHKDTDIYVDIESNSSIKVPKAIYFENIKANLKSTIKISHVGPVIIRTIIQE